MHSPVVVLVLNPSLQKVQKIALEHCAQEAGQGKHWLFYKK